jgi:Serine carboxypeptidase
MIGLFQELGPCGVDIHGKVYNNPYSWTTKRHVKPSSMTQEASHKYQ